jgi:hypothetical protein
MIRIMLKAFVSKYIYIFIKILDENFKNYTPNIPKYIISKGGVFSFFHLCCNTSAFYKVTINKGWLCLGLNNAFAFTQMFSPFVRCMHPMCFLTMGRTWRLKDYLNIHHFLIPLLLMLINLHLWILLAFQYAQINSFISSWQWFWHSWCNCIHSSQIYFSMNTNLSIFTINYKGSTWCSLSMFPLVYH